MVSTSSVPYFLSWALSRRPVRYSSPLVAPILSAGTSASVAIETPSTLHYFPENNPDLRPRPNPMRARKPTVVMMRSRSAETGAFFFSQGSCLCRDLISTDLPAFCFLHGTSPKSLAVFRAARFPINLSRRYLSSQGSLLVLVCSPLECLILGSSPKSLAWVPFLGASI